MRKLVDLSQGTQIERGLFPSLAPDQQELWKTGSNIEFLRRRVKKAIGYTAEVATGEISAITQAFVSGAQRAYYAEGNQISLYAGGVPTVLGSGLVSTGHNWSLETWGTFLLATNEEDNPKIWKNTGLLVDLGGLTGVRAGRKYRLFKKHKNHVMAYYGQRVEWSSESDVELWVPAEDNSAGGEDIRDLDSDIIAACQLGPDFALYSGDSMVIQRYVGQPFYFGFEPAIDGIGAVSDSAVVSVGNQNFGMSSKGFFKTDGLSYEYIDTPQINRLVFGDPANPEIVGQFYQLQGRKTVGLHDEAQGTVKWYFLGTGGIIHGVGYNYRNGTWTILDQMITAAASKQVFDSALIGTRTSFGFLKGENNGAAAMPSSLVTFPLDGGDREHYKQWDLIRINFEGSGLEVRFGFSDDQDTVPDWTAWDDVTRENWIDGGGRESVFLTVEFRSTTIDESWAITGFSIHGEMTGEVD